MSIASINPATGETLKEFRAFDSQQIEEKLAKSVHAFEQHRRTSFAQRRTLMITVADLLEREREHLARIMTLEMGKLPRAAAEEIKKSVLELGGSDPFIVMPSADLKTAIETGVAARMQNNGQSCIAAKRFILSDQIYDRFVSEFVERMRSLKVGDPLDATTEIGPLATEAILHGVDQQVQDSIAGGAKLLIGGKGSDRPGFFYEPRVLADVPRDSPVAREEIFGPVASIFRASSAAEAIEIGNDTSFGLGASAWTNDANEQQLFAAELETGMVFINSMVASDPRLPFGGAKRSGFGRELGAEGIREFVNIKGVSIA